MEENLTADKKALRKDFMEQRGLIPLPEARTADALIASHITGAGFFKDARSVLVYISVDREVDTTAIFRRAFAEGKTVCVPRTRPGRAMEAVPVGEEELFQRARAEWPCSFGIPEPPDAFQAMGIAGLDLVITPSLALDQWGYRLGHGGGYYDRFIAAGRAQNKRPLFAAPQRAAFIRNKPLPREDYDMTVDVIVTENGIFIPSSSV